MSNSPGPEQEGSRINSDLAQRIQEELGQNVYLCYQCVKCTSGCPVGKYFDWQPNQIMRAVQLGQEDIALEAQTPWLCASCQACTTRCPQDLDIAGIMDFRTREALDRGVDPPSHAWPAGRDAMRQPERDPGPERPRARALTTRGWQRCSPRLPRRSRWPTATA